MKPLMLCAVLLSVTTWAGEEGDFDPARLQSTEGKVPFFPLNDAKVLKAAEATYLDDGDYVLGVVLGGEARAYPARIIAFHHVVNDTVGGKPACLTY